MGILLATRLRTSAWAYISGDLILTALSNSHHTIAYPEGQRSQTLPRPSKTGKRFFRPAVFRICACAVPNVVRMRKQKFDAKIAVSRIHAIYIRNIQNVFQYSADLQTLKLERNWKITF